MLHCKSYAVNDSLKTGDITRYWVSFLVMLCKGFTAAVFSSCFLGMTCMFSWVQLSSLTWPLHIPHLFFPKEILRLLSKYALGHCTSAL